MNTHGLSVFQVYVNYIRICRSRIVVKCTESVEFISPNKEDSGDVDKLRTPPQKA